MDLAAFERELRAEVGKKVSRPFLCDGSPFDCQVFLVGINPATDIPLWPYWSAEDGCDKEAWLDAYRKKRGRYGPTRARLERLAQALAPIRALEANIFHNHSAREADLAKEDRETKVFDFLLKRLAPRVVFVYGQSAIDHLQQLTDTQLEHGVFTRVNYQGVQFDVLAGYHLAYQWSFEKVAQLGKKLLARCRSVARRPRKKGASQRGSK